MIEKKIEHLAYKLSQNKNSGEPGAIVFIGAGCSISAGIPKADEIAEYVLKEYKENPDIKCLSKECSYADVMTCLSPQERKKVFKHYVENSKTNVSHIYLAQLVKLGFVDYIVTVNFDDLAQRAMALHNIFPPIYDISILEKFTTTTIETKSITYLHGQYNGLWQLNTKQEMDNVLESGTVNRIFNQITNKRPWIVIGYSGIDKIFDELVKLGRFDNGLYWITYKDSMPEKNVCEKLLDKPNTESFLIKGYDADSFFLKLNAELKNEQPKFFSQPFSFLSEVLEGIIDIEDTEDYKSVKERFDNSQKIVTDAINRYEKTDNKESEMTESAISEAQLKAKLIDCLINEKYDEVEQLEKQVIDNGYDNLKPHVASIYYDWGTNLGNLAKTKTGEDAKKLYQEAFEKYAKAIEIKPDKHEAYYNWGTNLGNLAKTKTREEAEKLYQEAIRKFTKAIDIKSDKKEAYNNWGDILLNLAKTKTGAEANELFKQAFEKLNKCAELGGYVYNLACANALTNNFNEAFHWLEISLEKKEYTFEHVEKDEDWNKLRDLPKYKELKEKYLNKK